MQCACTSTVLIRLPLTTTSRRLPGCVPWGGFGVGVTLPIAQPTNAMPAKVLVSRSPLIGIFVPPSCIAESLLRLGGEVAQAPIRPAPRHWSLPASPLLLPLPAHGEAATRSGQGRFAMASNDPGHPPSRELRWDEAFRIGED